MKSLICLLILCAFAFASFAQTPFNYKYKSRLDLMWNGGFYIIYVNENGDALIVKGNYNRKNNDDAPDYKNVSVSKTFKLKSANEYFAALRKLATLPRNDNFNDNGDCPLAQLYFNGQKIFSGSYMINSAMEFQRPLMGNLPRNFSPYHQESNPWYQSR
ncbi:hypothetical protein D0C36_18835 [Mucilaginibacter conchicola]|uniref:Uncharacterized protein n=1 Tax=Mucilaginibacter conchicola TaxID=2303333 RepID=A0A372NPZ9_9SPHI|nr:hypothetical protein [Mucilaginibacter conchicola]RFZ91002.1 hypothetical protein D0C36_18835 [Mucilaginibacter conchicola]